MLDDLSLPPSESARSNSSPEPLAKTRLFEEIQDVSQTEKVAAALVDAFFSGKLVPGDRIVEREISRQMRVGTPTVREALISLQAQGYVRRMKNTCTYVTKLDAEEIRQIFALRTVLEGLALSWARPRVSASDLEELDAIVARMVEAGENKSRREFAEQDYRFHRRLWVLSGNAYLVEALDRLITPLFAFSVIAGGQHLSSALGRKHYELINAMRDLQEPEFSVVVGRVLQWFTDQNPFRGQ
jgi:DNA-binding GntR family transcriptional regulator